MFCPNCGKENQSDQNFCRSCGLKLDAISKVVTELLPSGEYAALQRRRRLLERMGLASLSIAGLIGLMSVIFAAALYKLVLFGPEILFWVTAIALTVFLLLAAGLIGYSKFFISSVTGEPQSSPLDESASDKATGKLLEERFFEPVPSVTEKTTDLLRNRRKEHRN